MNERLSDEQIEQAIASARAYEADEPGAYDRLTLNESHELDRLIQCFLQLVSDLTDAKARKT